MAITSLVAWATWAAAVLPSMVTIFFAIEPSSSKLDCVFIIGETA
jgi:hypothetical protein